MSTQDWTSTREVLLDRAVVRELLDAASPGPARLSMMDPDLDPVELLRENLSHGDGPVWGVMLPEHPETIDGWEDRPAHGVMTCWTGNGPSSEANARLYMVAPLLGRALLYAWNAADEAREDARHQRAKAEELEQARTLLGQLALGHLSVPDGIAELNRIALSAQDKVVEVRSEWERLRTLMSLTRHLAAIGCPADAPDEGAQEEAPDVER